MLNLKKFLNEEQDPKAIEKIASKLQDFLMNGEELHYIAVQKKPAVTILPDSIAVSDRRVIFCRPKNLGLSIEFQDYFWKDIKDCHLKEGFLGSEFIIKTNSGDSNFIDYLPKIQARKLYALTQEMEEKRSEIAKSESDLQPHEIIEPKIETIIDPTPASINASPAPTPDELEIALEKLKNLSDRGLITPEEYNRKKAELLSRL